MELFPRAIRTTQAKLNALAKTDTGRFFFTSSEAAPDRRVYLEDDGGLMELARVAYKTNDIAGALSVTDGDSVNAIDGRAVLVAPGGTVVLPTSPRVGFTVPIFPVGDLETTPASLDCNGKKIMGEAVTEPDPININVGFQLVYMSTDYGWGIQ